MHSGASCEERELFEQNALRKISERNAFLASQDMPVEAQAFSAMALTSWNSALLLAPYYPCPWELKKTASVSKRWDGGKWICGLQELAIKSGPCTVYSLGSNWETSFEQAISDATHGRCQIHIYDPTVGQNQARLNSWIAGLPKNMHFHSMGIKGGHALTPFPAITLGEAFAQNHHSAGIDMLKFDIESFEFELLETINWSTIKIGTVIFELHSNLIECRLPHVLTQSRLQWQFGRMEDAGYRLYSAEPVCTGCVGQVELAFIHRDWDPSCGFSCTCTPGSVAS